MRQVEGLWEYIAVYVDDLAIVSKTPELIVKDLTDKFHFKLIGPE